MTPTPFIDDRSKLPGTATAMMQPWTRIAPAVDPAPREQPRSGVDLRQAIRLTGFARS
jgi:hypothetical protein